MGSAAERVPIAPFRRLYTYVVHQMSQDMRVFQRRLTVVDAEPDALIAICSSV